MKKFEIELLTNEEVLSQLMCTPEVCWPGGHTCDPCPPDKSGCGPCSPCDPGF